MIIALAANWYALMFLSQKKKIERRIKSSLFQPFFSYSNLIQKYFIGIGNKMKFKFVKCKPSFQKKCHRNDFSHWCFIASNIIIRRKSFTFVPSRKCVKSYYLNSIWHLLFWWKCDDHFGREKNRASNGVELFTLLRWQLFFI